MTCLHWYKNESKISRIQVLPSCPGDIICSQILCSADQGLDAIEVLPMSIMESHHIFIASNRIILLNHSPDQNNLKWKKPFLNILFHVPVFSSLAPVLSANIEWEGSMSRESILQPATVGDQDVLELLSESCHVVHVYIQSCIHWSVRYKEYTAYDIPVKSIQFLFI